MPSPTTPAHAEVPVHLIVFRAELLHLKDPHADLRFQQLLKVVPPENISDTIQAQLDEYAKLRHPKRKLSAEETRAEVATIVDGSDLHSYGSWAYFAWTNRLVHLLPEAAFAFVRTNRNRNKITAEEQEKLSRLKVGVIGLSVGQSVSLAMALERSFGEIRLADFDTLDLSNLNRLRSGVHNLGVNKAIMTAREIAELDPYLKVVCFTDGLTKENMDTFFTGGGPLDVVVEECDSVDIKILARQKAKALGIPVVMDMSDRGCLDVERFDLEPDRPLMHGWIEHLDLDAAARPMTSEEKMPFMVPITGIDTLSPRMKASVIELNQSISTWPQLATSVVLGGALAGDAVRRIALGQLQRSGRWFVDLDELVADTGNTESPPLSDRHQQFALSAEEFATIAEWLGPEPAEAEELSPEVMEQLVEAGGMAPSAGNMQPWKFMWLNKQLLLLHDISRSRSAFDPDNRIAQIAMGACLENIVLRAHSLALEVVVRSEGLPSPLQATFSFYKTQPSGEEPHVADHLAEQIGKRCTNRTVSSPTPLPCIVQDQVLAAANSVVGAVGRLYSSVEQLTEIASICGITERMRLLNKTAHQEFFGREMRWNKQEVEHQGDGLDIATMVTSPREEAVFRFIADPRTRALLDQWGGGENLAMAAAYAIQKSSGVLLISTSSDECSARMAGGRAMERAWLAATGSGWSVHPVPYPIFLTHSLPLGLNVISDQERLELTRLKKRMDHLFELPEGHVPLFMMRLSLADGPTSRALHLNTKTLMAEVAKPHSEEEWNKSH
jgi:hypothetical protein